MNYYEQPAFTEIVIASHTVDGVHADLLQLDEDGEVFCSNVSRIDSEGYEVFLNNTGTVSFAEAFQAFGWDLDLFLDGASFTDEMFTADYRRMYPTGIPTDNN